MTVENHGSRFEGIPDRNLLKSTPQPQFPAIQSQQFQKFLLPVNRFGIFHGRPSKPRDMALTLSSREGGYADDRMQVEYRPRPTHEIAVWWIDFKG
jgi:hypothetical protein